MNQRGVIAAGHPETVRAARSILEEGGNAFDAAIAALGAACVAEPVLASLGGGGFLLAHTGNNSTLYDFFVQTPGQRKPEADLHFYPIHADFGTATQEFHIGRGSIAVPGIVKGIFEVHRDLCSMPLDELLKPAIDLARSGIKMNSFQGYITKIISPILKATPEARRLFSSPDREDEIVTETELFQLPELANTLENLCLEGEALFYQGEIARQISLDSAHGGTLSLADLKAYNVIKRQPLAINYRNHRIMTNPAPSTGGILIGFALRLLEDNNINPGHNKHGDLLTLLAHTMELTSLYRHQFKQLDEASLAAAELQPYRQLLKKHAISSRGTTHISIADRSGNLASLTLSNGEGSGYVIPDTGIMLNNMLGEEDLNHGGFHHWPTNSRLASMMAPSLIFHNDGRTTVLGSGGSNRIRTAILQTIVNLLDLQLPLADAICHPRIHFENGLLNLEPGFPAPAIEQLKQGSFDIKEWPEPNLFFGGVHGVMIDQASGELHGAGDPRRGGASVVI